jgi:hypothetical protein
VSSQGDTFFLLFFKITQERVNGINYRLNGNINYPESHILARSLFFKRPLMQKFTILLLITLTRSLPATLFAQTSGSTPASPYVFNEFVKSTVLQKNGGTVSASLNYNTITQEMMFEQNGSNIVMDKGNTDTIYLQNRRFIPAKDVYMEKLTNTPAALYVQYKNKAVPEQKGEKANTVLSEVYKKKEVGKVDPYALKLAGGFRLLNDDRYWLQSGKELIALTSIKKIPALFPKKEAGIAIFISNNNISLTSKEDMIRLIVFCNQ